MSKNLIDKFIKLLSEPDPPHALLLKGIISAANMVKSMNETDRILLIKYIGDELTNKGDTPFKEQLIKVLQVVGGDDVLSLLEKIINEGEACHGKFLVDDAIGARAKLLK